MEKWKVIQTKLYNLKGDKNNNKITFQKNNFLYKSRHYFFKWNIIIFFV